MTLFLKFVVQGKMSDFEYYDLLVKEGILHGAPGLGLYGKLGVEAMQNKWGDSICKPTNPYVELLRKVLGSYFREPLNLPANPWAILDQFEQALEEANLQKEVKEKEMYRAAQKIREDKLWRNISETPLAGAVAEHKIRPMGQQWDELRKVLDAKTIDVLQDRLKERHRETREALNEALAHYIPKSTENIINLIQERFELNLKKVGLQKE